MSKKVNKEYVDYVLETLSFFDPLNKEQIIYDFDQSKLESLKDFTMDDLDLILDQLILDNKIQKVIKNEETAYIKSNTIKKKSLLD